MTNRGEIYLRDIANKITSFQSLSRFIRLKRFLLRTLAVNIAIVDIFWRLEDAGVPADLDPSRFRPPGPNPLADMDPPIQIRQRIWTPQQN